MKHHLLKLNSLNRFFRRWILSFERYIVRHLPPFLRRIVVRRNLNLVYDLSEDYVFKVADSHDDLDAAFRLLHNSYVSANYMKPHPSGLRVLFHHALPSTTTLIAKFKGQVVGTMTLIRDNPLGLPLESSFDVSFLRKNNSRVLEISSFAIRSSFRGQDGVIFPLTKFAMEYGRDYFGSDYAVCVVNPKHDSLYEELLCFKPLGNKLIKNYGFANGAPAVAKYIDVRNLPIHLARSYGNAPPKRNLFNYLMPKRYGGTYFKNLVFPDREYNTISDPILRPETLNEFFLQRTEVFHDLDPTQTQLISSLYKNWKVLYKWSGFSKRTKHGGERRHEVNCRGRVQLGKFKKELKIINVSRNGLAVICESPLRIEGQYSLKAAISPYRVANLCIIPKWSSSKGIYGFSVVESDDEWDEFITTLDLAFNHEFEILDRPSLKSS